MRHLYILWTNADPITSENMVMMYATNSIKNDWWDKVTVIIWGAPQKLLIENEVIRTKCELARHVGVEFSACQACAINLGTLDKLNEMSIEVIKWGQKLTELIQNGEHLITV
ncbi:MAG TPA: DsrE family protein [Lachnospiraceae bacterium]|nr:DsrE family protein [Lachnospiraceae bacterium]